MTFLALDSCRRAELSVLRTDSTGEMIDGAVFNGALALTIPQALSRYLTPDCDGVAVVVGPGSYTGIRAGIAAAKALFGARGIKVYATGRLAALAAVHNFERTVCVLEAGRGGIYAQTFTGGGPPHPTAQPGHHTLSEWSPPQGHTMVSDFDLANARRCEPLDILAAGARVAISCGTVELSELRALYVSQPEFTRQTVIGSSAK
jgi:tRNA threonylcarbamoyl adenosine modification protein YeaZ